MDLLASRSQEEKLQKEKNILQNTINILKLRVERLEGHVGGNNKPVNPEKCLPADLEDHIIQKTVTVTEPRVLFGEGGMRKTAEYEKNKNISALVPEKKRSEDLLDTDTVIIHLDFANSQSENNFKNSVILYDKHNPGKSEVKTVGELRAISRAFNQHFPNDDISTKNEDMRKHLEVIDQKLEDLQKSTAETQAAMSMNDAKYEQNSENIIDKLSDVEQKLSTLVQAISSLSPPHSIRQLNLVNASHLSTNT